MTTNDDDDNDVVSMLCRCQVFFCEKMINDVVRLHLTKMFFKHMNGSFFFESMQKNISFFSAKKK